MRLLPVSLLLLLLSLFSGCFGRAGVPAGSAAHTEAEPETSVIQERTAEEIRYDALRQTAARIAAALDDRQLAAQVIISGIDGKGRLTEGMKVLLTECPAGGIMLFRYNLDTDNDAIQSLLTETAELVASGTGITFNETDTAIPPFIAVDHEGGVVNRFRPGVADLPPAVSYYETAHDKGHETAIADINADSFNAGKAVRCLGVTMNFAPVAEYLSENNRDFLDNRSYGPDPDFTAKAAGAFIAGMERAGILCVVKHFPGSAGADPHLYPSVLPGDRAAIAGLTSPFAALIRSGQARALMVAHSSVPAWDSTIASLSPVIMGSWLRQELGFEGIIICDDFSMAAAGGPVAATGRNPLQPETAAVLSLASGADMVLVWPPDIRRTHRAILAALTDESNGDTGLSRERLREAAGRIIFEKLRMGLINEG